MQKTQYIVLKFFKKLKNKLDVVFLGLGNVLSLSRKGSSKERQKDISAI